MVGVASKAKEVKIQYNGLSAHHGYTILNTYTVNDTTGNQTKLLLMRNPWAIDGSYNGTWSDNDPIWMTNNYKA